MSDDVQYDLADDAPLDLAAVARLAATVEQMRVGVKELAGKHADLAKRVDRKKRGASSGAPGHLRWAQMDRVQASDTWVWLIDWVGWFVDRFELPEEIPPCWPRHSPLVEELTALCASWHAAYAEESDADAPRRWMETLARARTRIRDWDDQTKCRNGAHSTRRLDLAWPSEWRSAALDFATGDAARHPAKPSTKQGERS